VVEIADCGGLDVVLDAKQAAKIGFKGGQAVRIGLPGNTAGVALHLPPVLPGAGQITLRLDPAQLQATGGDACPIGQTVSVQAK
jgi:hypothetical protein